MPCDYLILCDKNGSDLLSFQAMNIIFWEVGRLSEEFHTVIGSQINVLNYLMNLLRDRPILTKFNCVKYEPDQRI